MAPLSPIGDEPPAVDRAEIAVGHPHTLGVEYSDDETLVPDGTGGDVAEFGESPDIETHDYEEPLTL
ncbi:hypothetical protein [Conyzicola sp.]|uniref:hypothetical protein n=1 Tax=Conyzicola sp. TaxID=1969404 RepID=UPI0039895187